MLTHRAYHLALAAMALTLSQPVTAGCIGTVIMGKCHGTEVTWDTHEPDFAVEDHAPPGWYWDKRSVPMHKTQPFAVDPFTGRDAHDPVWIGDVHKRRCNDD